MTVEISYDELRYDPSIARAAVRRNGSDWAVLLEHADSTPVHRLIVGHDEIAIEVGAAQALDHDAVMGFIEHRLTEAGYSAVREQGEFPHPFIGALQLGPKE
jgi:hypothetical protein